MLCVGPNNVEDIFPSGLVILDELREGSRDFFAVLLRVVGLRFRAPLTGLFTSSFLIHTSRSSHMMAHWFRESVPTCILPSDTPTHVGGSRPQQNLVNNVLVSPLLVTWTLLSVVHAPSKGEGVVVCDGGPVALLL